MQHNGSVKNITVVDESNNEIPVEIDSANKVTKKETVTNAAGITNPNAAAAKVTENTAKSELTPNTLEPATKEVPFIGASTVDLSGGDVEFKLLQFPFGETCFTQVTWVLTWPIYLVFKFTIPDCEKSRFKTWYPLTFIMCIVWIGSLSYLVAWFITIVGKYSSHFSFNFFTFQLPQFDVMFYIRR